MTQKRVRILLVEDDVVDRMAVERLVLGEGLPYDLLIAKTAAEADVFLRQGQVDMALVDYNLPDGNGLEVLKNAGKVPCIFITGINDTALAVKVMKAGASDFLVKDYHRTYLKLLPAVVQKALMQNQATAQIDLQQQIINQLREMVVWVDEEGKVVFANAAADDTLGISTAKLVGTTWGEGVFVDAGGWGELRAHVMAGDADGALPGLDLEMCCRSGCHIWMTWTGICHAQGGLVLVGHEITSRKAMEAILKRLRAELEKGGSAELAQIVLDLEGEINRQQRAENLPPKL